MINYLEPLLKKGADKLPAGVRNKIRSVPLYVMATAGVRGVQGDTEADGERARQAIMSRAWNAIRQLRVRRGLEAFNVGRSNENSFVVTEKAEGVYAWIALNRGRFQPDQMPGILELGGQSMQITFADPTTPVTTDTTYFGRPVCLFRSRHLLKSLSWKLGAEESRSKVFGRVIHGHRPLPALPAMPRHHIYNPCLPHHEQLDVQPLSVPSPTVEMYGSGDFSKCLALAQSHLDHFPIQFPGHTGTLPDPLPPLDIEPFTKRFYGLSSFYYTWEFFSRGGHYDIHSPYNPKLFRQAVDDYCNGSWLQPFAWNEDGVRDNPHVHKHCFAAAWMMALFHGRKGFNLRLSDYETWKDLIRFPSTDDLGSRSSWTIGAANMFARNGGPSLFCTGNEGQLELPYPPPRHGQVQGVSDDEDISMSANGTTISIAPDRPIHASSAVVPPMSTHFPIEFAQPIHASSTPSVVAGSLLPNFPLSPLNPVSTFSQGLGCGILLLALVLIGYRRFSTRRVPVPVSDKKHSVDSDVDAQPIMVRAHRALFDKGKGDIFLAGGGNISVA